MGSSSRLKPHFRFPARSHFAKEITVAIYYSFYSQFIFHEQINRILGFVYVNFQG